MPLLKNPGLWDTHKNLSNKTKSSIDCRDLNTRPIESKNIPLDKEFPGVFVCKILHSFKSSIKLQ